VYVTYIYRCTVFPLGQFWGASELWKYVQLLEDPHFPDVIHQAATTIWNLHRWNVPIRGHAIMDYWAD
jgi:hypothetical protein